MSASVSFEFFPPRTPESWERFRSTLERLKPLEPAFVSVTYGAGGSTR
ncbi:MAG: methylenetetrahydrofolate reductase, partial [Solirubrobacteraceae bacterium]